MAKKFVSEEAKRQQLKEFETAINSCGNITGLCYVVETEDGSAVGVQVAQYGALGAINLAMQLLGSIGQQMDADEFNELCPVIAKQVEKLPKLVAQTKVGEQVGKSKLS